tara:strand:- start:578 stop:844 length:267 start_codon:yes stop_codon:yes gene_type:complete
MTDEIKETPKTREEILLTNLEARVQEIMHYQINIDNYTLALEEMGNMPPLERNELANFADQIRGLLASEIMEQKKAKLMFTVLKKQVG